MHPAGVLLTFSTDRVQRMGNLVFAVRQRQCFMRRFFIENYWISKRGGTWDANPYLFGRAELAVARLCRHRYIGK